MTAEQEASMPTPVNILWDNILMISLVGIIDTARAQEVMETVLNKVLDTSSKTIIIDILGIPTVDSSVANHLIQLSKATYLMGCECIITGIAPVIAQTLVSLGIELGDVITKASLRDGLEHAFNLTGQAVVKRG